MAIDKSLFARLKRLFSNDLVIRNIGGTQLKVVDIDKIQSLGIIQTNSLVDRFTKLYTTSGTGVYNLNNLLNYQTLRIQLYTDYESMDTDAIIASTLDILSDECTLKDEGGEMLHIRSSDESIQKILYNLFYDVLNVEFNLWGWTRQMCKYGDFYLKLEIAEEFGVYNVIPYSAYNIIREEGTNPANPSYVRFRYDPNGLAGGTAGSSQVITNPNLPTGEMITFENYEMAHFRLIADSNYLPFGRSFIEPARKTWKAYTLIKDALLVHRITRAPERRIFYLNIGNIPPNEVDAYVQKVIQTQKKTPYMDPQTGQYNLKFNMQNMLEDFYIPVRGNDQSTKIDTLKGLEYNGIEDVNFFREELFAALKVPKTFLNFLGDVEGKSTLAAQDVRFARTVEHVQKIILSELTKIALIHLYTQGYEGESLTNFELSLTTPSIIYDQERVNLMKEKVELASQILENNLFPTDYIYDKIFHLSEDQYSQFRDLIVQDKMRDFRYGQLENEGNDPAESGESYGTPHDLATLYGKTQMNNEKQNLPPGYDEHEQSPGRPEEKVSNINKQDNPFGKDRLGKNVLNMRKNNENPKGVQPNFKNGSPIIPESLSAKNIYFKNRKIFDKLPVKNDKKLIFEANNGKSILDEDNLLPD